MISIEGFVLAGGQSRRMGQDKASLLLGGKTLIDRAAAALSVIADPVYAVGNLTAELTSLPIIQDEPVGMNTRGAIIGLYTTLVRATTEWVAVLACDLPFVSGELLVRMVLLLKQFTGSLDNKANAVLAEQPNRRIQPLCGLYRAQICLPEVEKMLSEGNWRLQDLSKRVSAHILRFSEFEDIPGAYNLLLNVNTPEDYRSAVARESALRSIWNDEQMFD